MNPKTVSREVEEATRIITDLMDTIRINMEILEIMKLKGRIRLTNKQFIEITELDRKHHMEFQRFMMVILPDFIDGDVQTTHKVLKKTFLVWATDLQISLRYLDIQIKNFLKEINEKDLKNLRSLTEPEVKDKRFWKFLDKVRLKSRIFDSFEEPEDAEIIEIEKDTKKEREKDSEK